MLLLVSFLSHSFKALFIFANLSELLRALSSRFEEKVVQIISPVINSEVQKYHENPAANWKSMNAVCSTIVAICSKTETQKYGATNVSSLV